MESIAKAIWQAVWKNLDQIIWASNCGIYCSTPRLQFTICWICKFWFPKPSGAFPKAISKALKNKVYTHTHTHTHFWRFERYFMYPRSLFYLLARISTYFASIRGWSRYERVLDDVEEVPLGPWRVNQSVRCEDFVHQQNGENQLLVTDKPVEGEKWSVEVEDFSQITHHFREIYGTRLQLIETKPKDPSS
jgi:hypothetical protein